MVLLIENCNKKCRAIMDSYLEQPGISDYEFLIKEIKRICKNIFIDCADAITFSSENMLKTFLTEERKKNEKRKKTMKTISDEKEGFTHNGKNYYYGKDEFGVICCVYDEDGNVVKDMPL